MLACVSSQKRGAPASDTEQAGGRGEGDKQSVSGGGGGGGGGAGDDGSASKKQKVGGSKTLSKADQFAKKGLSTKGMASLSSFFKPKPK